MLRSLEEDLAAHRASARVGCQQKGSNVRPSLTANVARRRGRPCETPAYAAFVLRVIAAYGRRVAEGDLEDLAEMLAVDAAFDDAVTVAVRGGNAGGWSWAQVGAVAGMRRQSAHERWGGS